MNAYLDRRGGHAVRAAVSRYREYCIPALNKWQLTRTCLAVNTDFGLSQDKKATIFGARP
jgi:hypothetical protein